MTFDDKESTYFNVSLAILGRWEPRVIGMRKRTFRILLKADGNHRYR